MHTLSEILFVSTYLKHSQIKPLVSHRASVEFRSFWGLLHLSDQLHNACPKMPVFVSILGKVGYVLTQVWGRLILEGHSPAEFSSNPEKPWTKIPNCILKP